MPDRATRGRANQAAGRAEERACANILALAGFIVYPIRDFGQARGAKGTRYSATAPGVPDLFAVHTGGRFALWWEVKTGGAKLTPEQQDFQSVVGAAVFGLVFAWGDRAALRSALVGWGFLRDTPDGVTIDRLYPNQGRIVTSRRAKR